jgi:serine protease inhibitor
MKKIILPGIILLVVIVAAATYFIFPYNPTQPPLADDSEATEQGIAEVIMANNRFAFDIYNELGQGNVFFSPYSISSALAMTYEGAAGKTADEMKAVFYFPDGLRENFPAVYNKINKKNDAYESRTGNALWVQQDFYLKEDYRKVVESYYGGKAANVDFVKETERTRQTINSFIEEQTNNRIKDLIPQGMLDPMTRLVLTNAIYFKGKWVWEFKKSETRQEDFFSPSGTVKVDMMHLNPEKAMLSYAENDEVQILKLPYKGEELSMLIILPKKEVDFTMENFERWKGEMSETKLSAVYLPKFEFDTKYFMKGTLAKLGMPTAFSGGADFSKMANEPLHISEVIHQAFVKVDEEGTEAAAATAVVMRLTSAGPMTVFRADRPFVFIIQDSLGTILFMGRVEVA